MPIIAKSRYKAAIFIVMMTGFMAVVVAGSLCRCGSFGTDILVLFVRLVRIHKTLDTKCNKVAVHDVGVSIEVLRLRTLAHRVYPEADVLQGFLGV